MTSEPTNTLVVSRRVPDALFEELSNEASIAASQAEAIKSDSCALDASGSIGSRGSCRIAGPRKHLNDFHHNFGFDLAREFAGASQDLMLTRASYIYYEAGDYTFFHHDTSLSHITVIVGLSTGLLPLFAYPSFGPIMPEDVIALNEINPSAPSHLSRQMQEKFGPRATPIEIEITKQYAVAIRGRRMPHARPKQPVAGRICTACYAFVLPEREWLTPRNDAA